MRSILFRVAWVSSAIGVLGGCATETQSGSRIARSGAGGVSAIRLANVSIDRASPAARRVFRDHFALDNEASGPNLLVSKPTEAADGNQAVGVRGALSGARNRQRRIAELQLLAEGSGTLMRIQVRVERQEAAEREAFARQHGDDRPTDTPIDRVGPSSPGGRQDWVPAGRDRTLEQEILSNIEKELVDTRAAE